MGWIARARSRATDTKDRRNKTREAASLPKPLEILDTALALRAAVLLVTPEEFYWQDARYDHDSERGRELLFLVANHEWVRATSEIVDIVRSDSIETTIKTDIDLSQIRHEAFRGKTGRVWLPITVLPPQTVQRQLEPDLFATVTDAAGNLLPLLPAEDLGHQMSAALAEIIVNMAVAHWPGLAGNQAEGGSEESRSYVSRLATRDQRVLLSAAIYRILRHGPASTGRPGRDQAAIEAAAAEIAAGLPSLLAGRDASAPGPGLASATSRTSESRRLLLVILDTFNMYLAQRAGLQVAEKVVPRAQFAPELAYRAVRVLEALGASTIVVVPVDFDTEPTVLTVRVPNRILKPAWTKFDWRKLRTWRVKPISWLIRPSGHLEIDVLLPTADADRQIQIRLADGVSFEVPPAVPDEPASPIPRLDIGVRKPPALQELTASVRAVFAVKKSPWPPSLTQALIDLARAKTAAAFDTLRHYDVWPGQDAAPHSPDDHEQVDQVRAALEHLAGRLSSVVVSYATLAGLREWWEGIGFDGLPLFRRTSVDRFDPRTVVAHVEMIEDVAQRATPKRAVVYADVKVDDRGYLASARASTLMSLILMIGVLAFLVCWHFVNPTAKPVPEVLAIVLILFVTIQAGRIERPDRSTLHGQLSGTGSLLIAASVFPAVMLAVALAFEPSWWAREIWAGVCVAVQAAFVGLTLWGPLTAIRSFSFQKRGRLSVGRRRNYQTDQLDYSHFEALRSDYWRNTTADALMIGRVAYGYVISQETDDAQRTDGAAPPQLERILGLRDKPGAPGESNSVLALLHSSTQRQSVTFAVFRGKPADDLGDEFRRRAHIENIEDLHIDADRLAPTDNVSSTVDIFIGVHRSELPAIAAHPLIEVLKAAKNKLITLQAQLPVPGPGGAHHDRQWARVRVALRDNRDIRRLTEFLDEIYEKIIEPKYPGHLIALQAVPIVPSREITGSPTDSALPEEVVNRTGLWGGDLDVSGIAEVRNDSADDRAWRMIAIHADARSNIESDIIECLPVPYKRYQLAHLNYALLHGMAVIIMLIHEAAAGNGAKPPAGRPAARKPQGQAAAAGPGEGTEPAWGQPRVLINKNVSIRELGPLTEHPLLRIRFRWQDQPGAFLNVVNAVSDFLEAESPPVFPANWSISYARLQVATGRVALGHLTIRLHDTAQDRKRWNSTKTEQMGREVSARAGRYATSRPQSAFRGTYPDSGQNPVMRVDFISKDPPDKPTRPARS